MYRVAKVIYIDKPGNEVFPSNEERVILNIDEVVEYKGEKDTRTIDIAFPRDEFLEKWKEAEAGCFRILEGEFMGRLFIPGGGWVPSEPNDPGWVTDYNNYFMIPVVLILDGMVHRGKVRLDYHLGERKNWRGPL